jgi:hypothetical protein
VTHAKKTITNAKNISAQPHPPETKPDPRPNLPHRTPPEARFSPSTIYPEAGYERVIPIRIPGNCLDPRPSAFVPAEKF